MTRMTRMMFAAALFVAVGSPASRAVEPDKLLPEGTDGVAIINVRQIIDSEIFKKYAQGPVKQALDKADARKILGDLGLDPLKDIHQVVVGIVDTSYKPSAQPKIFGIVHGKFDRQKLMTAAEAQAKKDGDNFAIVKDGNTVLFRFLPPMGGESIYAAIVNDETIFASNEKKLVTATLKAAATNQAARVDKDLAALLSKLDDKAALVAATVVKGKIEAPTVPPGLPVKLDGFLKALPGVESLTSVVKIGKDIDIEATLEMKDVAAANDMRTGLDELLQSVKGLLALAGMQTPQIKPLGDVLAGIQMSSRNKSVNMSAKITGEVIGTIISMAGKK